MSGNTAVSIGNKGVYMTLFHGNPLVSPIKCSPEKPEGNSYSIFSRQKIYSSLGGIPDKVRNDIAEPVHARTGRCRDTPVACWIESAL